MTYLRGGSRLMQFVCALPILFAIAACSSGGDGSGGGTTPIATPSVGVFVDSPVQGLGYTSVPSGLTGLTNASGQYNYLPGDTVTFTLYGRPIGIAVPAGPVVTALLVFNATSLTDPQVVNLSQLLLTLAGGAPAPGNPIVLPANAPPNFPAAINFSAAGFDTSFPGLTLVSEATATTHLQSSFKTVAVTIVNSGTVTSAPAGISCTAGVCSAVFTSGTVVTLTATGTGFTGWGAGTGSATCTGTGTCAVTLNADSSVTATFPVAPPPATVTILPNGGTGTGSVTCSANGGGFAACAASYPSGTPLIFRATANSGSTFTGWSDGTGNAISCNGTAIDCSINVTADSMIRANFTLPVLNSVTGTIASANGGGGAVTCSANGGAAGPCGSYPVSSAIVMTATPNGVSNFSGWSGAGCSGTGTCNFTLTADTTVTANFNRPTLTLVAVGTGTVSSNPVGINNCTTNCTAPFDRGSSVTLTAGPGLSAWSGGGCSVGGTCVVPLNGDITVTATFGGGGGLPANIPISTAPEKQQDPQIISDGSGGAIIVWQDQRNFPPFNPDIYAQRVNSAGVVQWGPNGVPICTAAATQALPKLIPDGLGGAIIAWEDSRSGTGFTDIYAQRVNYAGVVQWAANGVPIAAGNDQESNHRLAPDGAAGAIIVWERGGGTPDIYAQRVNSVGVVQWTLDGIAIATSIGRDEHADITVDGAGGAIIVWQGPHPNAAVVPEIYAQRVNGAGVPQWTIGGVPITSFPQPHGNPTGEGRVPKVIADGAGGAVIAWAGEGDGAGIRAQRISNGGVVQWAANGVVLAMQIPSSLQVTSDNANGAIVSWADLRNTANYDVYAQRVTSAGVVSWTTDGVAIVTGLGSQDSPKLIADGAGGAIIVWQDKRNITEYDIYAQRMNSAGAVQWTANGVAISTAAYDQMLPVITTDSAGGAFIAWQDERNDPNNAICPACNYYLDIYSQRVNGAGVLQ